MISCSDIAFTSKHKMTAAVIAKAVWVQIDRPSSPTIVSCRARWSLQLQHKCALYIYKCTTTAGGSAAASYWWSLVWAAAGLQIGFGLFYFSVLFISEGSFQH